MVFAKKRNETEVQREQLFLSVTVDFLKLSKYGRTLWQYAGCSATQGRHWNQKYFVFLLKWRGTLLMLDAYWMKYIPEELKASLFPSIHKFFLQFFFEGVKQNKSIDLSESGETKS